MFYRRLCIGVNDKGILVPSDKFPDSIKLGNKDEDYYLSIFMYNEEQKKEFDVNGSIAGITDVVTDKLVWDFDGELTQVKQDTIELCNKLISYGIKEENLQISFSGSKGYHVEISLSEHLTVDEFKAMTQQIANGLKTYDIKISNPSRILRGLGSIHLKTGLYKIPLQFYDLCNATIEQIKQVATSLDNVEMLITAEVVTLPENMKALKKFKEEYKPKVTLIDGLDDVEWGKKLTPNMPNCRHAISLGLFAAGERNNALMSYCAWLKNAGYPMIKAHHELKGAAEMQSVRTGQERFSKKEIWETIVKVVYSPSWKNGTFTCRKPGWLQEFCLSLGDKRCSHKTDVLVDMPKVYSLFKDYTEQYENNVLYSGIPELDSKMKFMVGTSNGILAPPGVGKTSLCLQILEHNSRENVPCLFYSYDMFHSALYMRMLQRQSGLQQDDIYKAFKNNPESVINDIEALEADFKNVQFCFKSGQTIDELEASIVEAESKLGRKPKLVVVDYNELVMTGEDEEQTSSTAIVAQRLRQIANNHEVAIITLLQPSKAFTSPADEITNYNSVKGSSSTVQSLTLLLGCSRPGFGPLNSNTDKFFNITCLKNRNGPLFTLDLSWEGLTGRIDTLGFEDRVLLNEIRAKKAASKNDKGGWQ